MKVRSLAVLAAVLTAACGGGSDEQGPPQRTFRDYVSLVTLLADGTQATYHAAALPAAGAGPGASAANSTALITGGTATFTVTGTGAFTTVYVGVQGVTGYWELTVPSGAVQDIAITFGQRAPTTFSLRVGVAAGAGAGAYDVVPLTLTRVGTGALQVSLSWNNASDVDLHLVEPGGEEIYYGNGASAAGGTLDLDSNAACTIDGVNNENITYGSHTPPSGTYTVRVDYWDACAAGAANYVVTVNNKGVVTTYSGSLAAPGDQGGAGSGVTVATFTF
jgi:hypothetical protein